MPPARERPVTSDAIFLRGERLVFYTDDYAPADTDLPANADFLGRFASERVERHTVAFREFRVPVVIYREHLLANDSFTTKYAVQEPDLLPGDEELIEECKDRIWETNVDGVFRYNNLTIESFIITVYIFRIAMSNNRRSFLKGIGVASTGIPVIAQNAIGKKGDYKPSKNVITQANSIVDEKTDEDPHDETDEDGNNGAIYTQSSTLRLLEVFKTETDGWEAYIGLGGCVSNVWKGNGTYTQQDKYQDAKFEVVNGDSSYDPPVIPDSYRGFTPESEEPVSPNLPGWVEPTFDIAVSSLVAVASSSPHAGITTAIALSADDILSNLTQEGNSEESFSNNGKSGKRVSYTYETCGVWCSPDRTAEMTQYARINPKFGTLTGGKEVEVTSEFIDDFATDHSTDVSFDVYAWDDDSGSVTTSNNGNIMVEEMSAREKEKYGYVEVDTGEPQNLRSDPDGKVTSYVNELNKRVKGREVTAVLMDPPGKVEAKTQ